MKNRYKLGAIAFVALLVMTTLGIFVTRQDAQDNTQQPINQQEQDDPPTPIKLGVMSEKQKRNSKRYKGAKNKKSPLSKRDNTKILFEAPYIDTSVVYSKESNSSEYTLLKYLSCKSAVIVIGRVNSKSTQLSEDEKLTFTDYEINVLNVLKNNGANNIQNKSLITLTNIGGAVLIDGKTIETIIKTVPNPKVGKDYLMFISYLPESDSYKLVDINGLYKVSGNSVKTNRTTPNTFSNTVEDVKKVIEFIQTNTNNCSQETN